MFFLKNDIKTQNCFDRKMEKHVVFHNLFLNEDSGHPS